MCSFCENEEEISKELDINEKMETCLSLSIDEESKLLKVRLGLGGLGYTLPIKANYCMFCGNKINE